jgi:predicted dehydrogenase
VRYLVVGLGNIGQRRRALLGERCVATADPFNTDADFGDPRHCQTDRYDAVVVATPNESKVGLLDYFLSHGKHVLVEKPLLLPDRPTFERLRDLTRTRGVTCYTSYNHRFEPLVQRTRELLVAGAVGDLYHARLFYGNGTVRNVMGTWRDSGLGVLEDLGSHLLDLAGYLLGCRGSTFTAWSLARHEAHALDHIVVASTSGHVVLEASYLSWKNSFSIDVYGSGGSLHLHGLPKWGPSSLVVRERVLPSGVPREQCERAQAGPDATWARDLEYFEQEVARGAAGSLDNDMWISETLRSVAEM